MKIYFHLNVDFFSNSYIIVNEKTNEALLIDPGKITKEMINQLEDNHYKPVAVVYGVLHIVGYHKGGKVIFADDPLRFGKHLLCGLGVERGGMLV